MIIIILKYITYCKRKYSEYRVYNCILLEFLLEMPKSNILQEAKFSEFSREGDRDHEGYRSDLAKRRNGWVWAPNICRSISENMSSGLIFGNSPI